LPILSRCFVYWYNSYLPLTQMNRHFFYFYDTLSPDTTIYLHGTLSVGTTCLLYWQGMFFSIGIKITLMTRKFAHWYDTIFWHKNLFTYSAVYLHNILILLTSHVFLFWHGTISIIGMTVTLIARKFIYRHDNLSLDTTICLFSRHLILSPDTFHLLLNTYSIVNCCSNFALIRMHLGCGACNLHSRTQKRHLFSFV